MQNVGQTYLGVEKNFEIFSQKGGLLIYEKRTASEGGRHNGGPNLLRMLKFRVYANRNYRTTTGGNPKGLPS
jgi:hypothetical protein